MATENCTVCLYYEGLNESLQKFATRVWPANDLTSEEGQSVAMKPRSPVFLFLRDEEVLGHIATIPVQLSANHQIFPGHWVVGFMVLPEYRNGLIGPLLIKKVNENLDLAFTLHVEEAPLRIFKGLGWKHLGVIPQYVYMLNAHRFFHNIRLEQMTFLEKYSKAWANWFNMIISHALTRFLMTTLASLIFSIFSLVTIWGRLTPERGTVREEKAFEASYDTLWQRVQGKFDALIVRDRAYLEARYGQQMSNYRLLACRHREKLLGYLILKIKQFQNDPRMGNIRMGTIVDCLFDPADRRVQQSLLVAAMRLCRSKEVDVIFCTASHFQVQELLMVNGFIKLPGNLHFAYYDRKGCISPHLELSSWHLMRGDSDADANF